MLHLIVECADITRCCLLLLDFGSECILCFSCVGSRGEAREENLVTPCLQYFISNLIYIHRSICTLCGFGKYLHHDHISSHMSSIDIWRGDSHRASPPSKKDPRVC